MVFPDAVGECAHDEGALVGVVVIQEGVIDATVSEEGLEDVEAARVLGICCDGDSFVGVNDCRIDTIQEILVVGGGCRQRFLGAAAADPCEEERRLRICESLR